MAEKVVVIKLHIDATQALEELRKLESMLNRIVEKKEHVIK